MKKSIIASFFLFCLFSLYSVEITVPMVGGEIHGDLLLPENKNNFSAVIIVPGSGDVDRDGNSGEQLQTNSYKLLAEELSEKGIAVFRYDKRLIGESQFKDTNEEHLTFKTYTDDLIQIINFIKKYQGVSKVILLGHSESSLILILAAQKESVHALIYVAGAGKNAADL